MSDTSTISREEKMVALRRGDDGKPSVWCDPEIADLVDALNNGQLATVASCSGHGFRPGSIALADGRYLMVFDSLEQAGPAERSYPLDINGDISAALNCEQEYEGENGWSEWIHPLPGYLMQCCDCDLVHEMQFMIGRAEEGGALNPGETQGAAIIFRARRLSAQPETPE